MIYKRGKVYHYQFQVNGKRYRGSARTTNKDAALRYESDRRLERTEGRRVEPVPFDAGVEQFLAWCAGHVKPRTRQRYGVSGKRLVAHFGDVKVDEITVGSIEAFKACRKTECSNAGVNRDLACLRTFLNWCAEMGYTAGVPKIRLFREPPGRMRIVTPEEEALYLANARQPLRDVAVLILHTGMRPSEVFSIRREDVKDGYLSIPEGKTDFARRTIPLSAAAREVLERRLATCNGFLFPHRLADKPMVVVRAHQRLKQKLKLDFRLYDLRHTFGSRAAMAGVDLPTLKELLGHSDIATTMRYIHPNPEHKKAAIEKLAAYQSTQKSHKIDTIVCN